MSAARAPFEVIVITGCGGMGIAIARRIGLGRYVVLADFNQKSLSDTASTLRNEGYLVHEVLTDVSDVASVANLVAESQAKGRVRTIVHTAGLSPVQASPKSIVDVDVVGTALVIEEFGKIVEPETVMICIASMAGTMAPLPAEVEIALAVTPTNELSHLPILDPNSLDSSSAYGIAKRANQVRVQAASVSWGARGARINSISPGIISTPMGKAELDGPSGDMMRMMIEMSGTKRIGSPDDIAQTVEWLSSSAASFVTGTDILVDGGVVAALKVAGATPQGLTN